MGKFLIVALAEHINEYKAIAYKYGVGFEYNDFYVPDILDSKSKLDTLIDIYSKVEGLAYNTLHGAFLDVTVFSSDAEIRRISKLRMRQSLDAARSLGAKAVVFHTNFNPFISTREYYAAVVTMTSDYLEELLRAYPDICIYMENMFEAGPEVLVDISKRLCQYENYGVCLDYAHASISSAPIEEWVERLHTYVRHLHINDNDLRHDLHLPIGEGKIDWDRFIDYYNRYFTACSVLIETTTPKNQVKSIEYLIDKGIDIAG